MERWSLRHGNIIIDIRGSETVMKNILFVLFITFALSVCMFAQDAMKANAEPTEADKTAAIPSDSYLKRGAPIGKSEKVALAKAFAEPAKYAGKTVVVEGV